MGELCKLTLPLGHLQHSADQGADHPVQEGVRGDPVDEEAVARLPRRLLHNAYEAYMVALRRSEGPEVVYASHEVRRLFQQAEVQLAGDVYGPPSL